MFLQSRTRCNYFACNSFGIKKISMDPSEIEIEELTIFLHEIDEQEWQVNSSPKFKAPLEGISTHPILGTYKASELNLFVDQHQIYS